MTKFGRKSLLIDWVLSGDLRLCLVQVSAFLTSVNFVVALESECALNMSCCFGFDWVVAFDNESKKVSTWNLFWTPLSKPRWEGKLGKSAGLIMLDTGRNSSSCRRCGFLHVQID